MEEVIILPAGVSFAILAFLLSLLPAGLFLWVWYLRRHDRPVPTSAVLTGLFVGACIVIPAFYLETEAKDLWQTLSPATVHNFDGALLPLQSPLDILLPAVGTFVIVATVEEGLRFLALWWWFRRSRAIDQVFDGLVVGLAAGLGFATLENTLYFLDLIQRGNFDTLIFVFFLRFLISTLAHISFGGIMGVLIARGVFAVYRPSRQLIQAFLLPWFVHGLFDLLLGINLSMYAVIILVPPLAVLILWSTRREFFVINRQGSTLLVNQRAPETSEAKLMQDFFKQFDSPWNVHAPWLREKRLRRTLLRHLESNAP
ncbi:MAG: PrsW family glutamic-type intramembrane protease [Candidatus Andersenbacteria bacterium]